VIACIQRTPGWAYCGNNLPEGFFHFAAVAAEHAVKFYDRRFNPRVNCAIVACETCCDRFKDSIK
jgi:hypothetical protein